ncbi:MAG: polysaccharide deacetylase family protein [Candidatus Hodarchaeota archaeon]
MIPTLLGKGLSILSQFLHFAIYRLEEPKMRLEKAMFIISVDVDVGNKELALINQGKNDTNVHDFLSEFSVGGIEEQALPLFVNFFNNLEIPVTFAIRGQLAEVDGSILDLLMESHIEHDIGSHGYFHRPFPNLSSSEAEKELYLTSIGMRKFGIIPRSFVFPKNQAAHLGLLEKYGYKCYRGSSNFLNDDMYVEKHGKLYNIHPSFYLGQSVNQIFLKEIVDISVKSRLPFHVWFHLWNFGKTKESIRRNISKVFYPLLRYAKKKEKTGMVTFETMLSITKKLAGERTRGI